MKKEDKTDSKYKTTHKLPPMEDSPINASNPQAGYGETTTILTRDQLAKML